ncbi:MAG: hypothetical protein ACHQHN_17175 [Sphingobacteriales bacterium]
MRKFYILLLVSALCGLVCSCKKESKNVQVNSTLGAYPNLIVGKWLSVKDHAKIYSSDGSILVKDTTRTITNDGHDPAWQEEFNKDGSAYKIYYIANSTVLSTDTDSNYKYGISGDNLLVYVPGSGASFPEPILLLNSTDLELETAFVTAFDDAQWNLPANESYKIVEDVSYKKQ